MLRQDAYREGQLLAEDRPTLRSERSVRERCSSSARLGQILLLVLTLFGAESAFAQTVLDGRPGLKDALQRFTSGNGGQSYPEAQRLRDQALLFANNDAINAARINKDISNDAYQAAQRDFDTLNTDFGKKSATKIGVELEVQARPGDQAVTFSPGTDSDYIAKVKSPEEIAKMQTEYNRRVNEYLQKQGVISEPRSNWHNRLDTDFMAASADHITEAQMREIAKMNNDAYKRKASAEFELISRSKTGGKIGPQHVTAYTEDMADFIAKKRGKIAAMRKTPSLFSDAEKRAEAIRMMAQEQKYVSRMEALDDFLRKQEGLPPRNRGLSIAKQGSVRDPSNVRNIVDAHQVTLASQGAAVDDLVETMQEVAKNNPNSAFAKSAPDDIARLIAQAPPEYRGSILAKLGNTDPDLAQAVTRSPSFSNVDDIVRNADRISDQGRAISRIDDAASIANKLDDLAGAGFGRRALARAASAMEAIGKGVERWEMRFTAAKVVSLFWDLYWALDPDLAPEEANALLEKIKATSEELRNEAAFAAILEAYPPIAVAYGTWIVTHHGGLLILENTKTGQRIIRAAGELMGDVPDRYVTAKDRLLEEYESWRTGKPTVRERDAQALCDKLKTGIRAGRYRIKKEDGATEEEACSRFRYGNTIDDIVERVEPKSAECTIAERYYASGRDAYTKGDADVYASALDKAEQSIAEAPKDSCGDLVEKIAKGREQIDVLHKIDEAALALLSQCKGKGSRERADRMQALSRKLSKTDHAYVSRLKARIDTARSAALTYAEARELFVKAELDQARTQVGRAAAKLKSLEEGDCPDLRASVSKAPDLIDRWQGILEKVDGSIEVCNVDLMDRYLQQLVAVADTKVIARTLAARIEGASDNCEKTEVAAQPPTTSRTQNQGQCRLTPVKCQAVKNKNVEAHLDQPYQRCLERQKVVVKQYQNCRNRQAKTDTGEKSDTTEWGGKDQGDCGPPCHAKRCGMKRLGRSQPYGCPVLNPGADKPQCPPLYPTYDNRGCCYTKSKYSSGKEGCPKW